MERWAISGTAESVSEESDQVANYGIKSLPILPPGFHDLRKSSQGSNPIELHMARMFHMRPKEASKPPHSPFHKCESVHDSLFPTLATMTERPIDNESGGSGTHNTLLPPFDNGETMELELAESNKLRYSRCVPEDVKTSGIQAVFDWMDRNMMMRIPMVKNGVFCFSRQSYYDEFYDEDLAPPREFMEGSNAVSFIESDSFKRYEGHISF